MKKSQWMVYTTILFSFFVFSFQAMAQADVVAAIKCPSPSQAVPGQKLGTSLSVWVRNQGNATAAKVVVDLFLSTNRSAPDKHAIFKENFEEDVLLQGGREQIKNLAPGQTVKVTLHGWNKIPADTPPGNYYIGVLADPHNLNNEPASTRKNNMAFCAIRIGQAISYRVTKVRAMVTPRSKVGKCPFRFNFAGYITTNGPCTVKYQWKRNDNATAPIKNLVFKKAGTQKVTSYWLLGGAGKTYNKFWEAVAVHAPNKMMSNKAYFNLKCTGGSSTGKMPDLIVKDIALVQGCKVKITLKNIGTAGVPAAKYNLPDAVGVQTYMDGNPWGGIILSGFDTAGKLKVPGGTASWILFPASKTLPAGTHSVKVVVDHNKNLAELNENNNTRTERLTCRTGATTAPSTPFQVVYPTNSQHFAITNNKIVITVRFNRPVNKTTVKLGSSFKVRTETKNNTPGTLLWKNSREVVFTSSHDSGQLCEFNPDCFFRVIITPAVKDTSGQALDGDKNGSPGGNFEHQFTIIG